MAGRPPKPEGEAVTRHPRKHNHGTLMWDGVRRGPELPSGVTWCDFTREWWDTWRDSPQAMLFSPTDWQEMLITARLHNQLWGTQMRVDKDGRFAEVGCTPAEAKALAGEIRIRLEKLGGTVKDRTTMGITIADPAEVVRQAEAITNSSGPDYRKRLTGD
jgi:hypothetical protein